jgi:HAE1 family hydrophobic/amphiphilic exporter-1
LDNLSMMALTLSVGFVVDDAIVMLENIVRRMEEGEGVFEAAMNGSKEIGFTILSMTLSLAAVFIPVLFMSGIIGRLFREFAVTIGLAILISGFVSLSLTPLLCSRFLRPPREERHGRFYAAMERIFQRMLALYEWSLRRVLSFPRSVMVFSAALLVATVYLFIVIPKGFLPSEDNGRLFAFTEAAQDISFEEMAKHQRAVAAILRQHPDVVSFSSSIGADGRNATPNAGRIFMRLRDRPQRRKTPEELIEELRPKLAEVPGIRVFLQNLPPIQIGGMFTKSLYQYTLQGSDTEELYRVAPLIESKMRALPELQDVTSDLQIANPQVFVEIDRDRASALGVTADQIQNALYSAYGSRQVSTIYTPSNEYWVILELEPRYQRDPAALSMLYIRSSGGRLVPLDAVAKLTPRVGPLTVTHLGQLPSVTISFNLKPGGALGNAVSEIEEFTCQRRHQLPGFCSSLPVISSRAWTAFANGDSRHLHGAGNSL